MITIIYRVSVTVPFEVWEIHGHSMDYFHAVSNAKIGNVCNETNTYDMDVEEIAEFHSLADAKRCEAALKRIAIGDFS